MPTVGTFFEKYGFYRMSVTSDLYPIGYNTPIYQPTTSGICDPLWRDEFEEKVGLGNRARLASFKWLAQRMNDRRSCVSLRLTDTAAEQGRAKRFLNNDNLQVSELIEHCCLNVDHASLKDKHLFAVFDESGIDYPCAVGRLKNHMYALGSIGNGLQYGQKCMLGLLYERKQFKPLGISSMSFHSHDPLATPASQRIGRDERPLPYRSSMKWLAAFRQTELRVRQAKGLTIAADREMDNLNVLCQAYPVRSDNESDEQSPYGRADVIIRAKHDRSFIVKEQRVKARRGKVRTLLNKQPPAGQLTVQINEDARMRFSADYSKQGRPRTATKVIKRKGRQARLQIKWVTGQLNEGHIRQSKSDLSTEQLNQLLAQTTWLNKALTYILLEEIDVNGHPIKVDKSNRGKANEPINWLLFTTLPVSSLADALEVINLYRHRFPLIEEFFRTVKRAGMNIESVQYQSVKTLQIITAMAMKTSAKIMKMVSARDVDEGYPIEDDFSIEEIEVLQLCLKKYEGKTIAQSNPHPTGQLSWAVWIIGVMGGWKAGNKQRRAGPKTLQFGLTRFNDIYDGIAMIKGWEQKTSQP